MNTVFLNKLLPVRVIMCLQGFQSELKWLHSKKNCRYCISIPWVLIFCMYLFSRESLKLSVSWDCMYMTYCSRWRKKKHSRKIRFKKSFRSDSWKQIYRCYNIYSHRQMPTYIYIYIHTGNILMPVYIHRERYTHIRMHTHIYSRPPHTPALDSLTYCLKESLEKTHKELSRCRWIVLYLCGPDVEILLQLNF